MVMVIIDRQKLYTFNTKNLTHLSKFFVLMVRLIIIVL